MKLWKEGKLDELVREVTAIQNRLRTKRRPTGSTTTNVAHEKLSNYWNWGDTSTHYCKGCLGCTEDDIQSSVGSVQLCGNQIAGCEAAVHAVKEMFKDEGTQGVLLVDATNAFNCLNRNVTHQNIQFNCPEIATILIITY